MNKIFNDLDEGEKQGQFVIVDSYDLENKKLSESRVYGFAWIADGKYTFWSAPDFSVTFYPFGRFLKKYIQEIK